MKVFYVLCIVIILACLYQTSIEPFFQGEYPSYTSTTVPCDSYSLSSIN